MATSEQPALILMDLTLPEIHGEEGVVQAHVQA
jgi:CheY-like chemotaxis protein